MSLNSYFVFSTMQRYTLFTMPYSLLTLFDRKACGAYMEFAADMANLAITVARTTIKTTFPLKKLGTFDFSCYICTRNIIGYE